MAASRTDTLVSRFAWLSWWHQDLRIFGLNPSSIFSTCAVCTEFEGNGHRPDRTRRCRLETVIEISYAVPMHAKSLLLGLIVGCVLALGVSTIHWKGRLEAQESIARKQARESAEVIRMLSAAPEAPERPADEVGCRDTE